MRVAYLGTRFHGWGLQPEQRTVQGELEGALVTVVRSNERLPVVCAGRTDTGVHATDQHVHVDLPSHLWPGAQMLQRRLNSYLPDDVRVRDVAVAPAGFDARFSVSWRQYRYTVDNGAVADPLFMHLRWHRPGPLDLDVMNRLGIELLGEHDFAALCRRRPEASTVRTVLALRWSRETDETAQMLVRADAFCHSMVRSLVGLMLQVGTGGRSVEWAVDLVRAGQRRSEVVTAPAHGLVLDRVHYADDLEVQAQRARRYRGR